MAVVNSRLKNVFASYFPALSRKCEIEAQPQKRPQIQNWRAARFLKLVATIWDWHSLMFCFQQQPAIRRLHEHVGFVSRNWPIEKEKEKHQQAVHNRRHNNTHAATMTTTAQLAIEAARCEATQKQNSSPHNHLHARKRKSFQKGLPRTTLVCLFLRRPSTTVFETSSQQQRANTRWHEEKSRFVYVRGISRCLKNTALSRQKYRSVHLLVLRAWRFVADNGSLPCEQQRDTHRRQTRATTPRPSGAFKGCASRRSNAPGAATAGGKHTRIWKPKHTEHSTHRHAYAGARFFFFPF